MFSIITKKNFPCTQNTNSYYTQPRSYLILGKVRHPEVSIKILWQFKRTWHVRRHHHNICTEQAWGDFLPKLCIGPGNFIISFLAVLQIDRSWECDLVWRIIKSIIWWSRMGFVIRKVEPGEHDTFTFDFSYFLG